MHTIRARLLIAFVSAVLLLGLAVGGASTLVALRSGQQHVINQLESVAALKEAEINRWVESLQIDLRVELLREPARQRLLLLLQAIPDSPQFQEAYLGQSRRFKETITLRPVFDELFLLDRYGRVVLSSSPNSEGEYRREQEYFREGLKQPGVYLQTFSVSGARADWNTIIAVYPITDEQGRTLGILAGRASLSTLSQIMRERAGLGATGETYLVNSNHVLLTPTRLPEYMPGQFFVHTWGVEAALREHRDGYGVYEAYHRERVIGVYRWLPQIKTVLVAEQREDEALTPVYTTIRLTIGLTLVAVLIAIVLSLFITRSIAAPIGELAETAAQIAGGDLSKTAAIRRRDEIGDLATAFNSMTAQLAARIRAEQERAKQVQQIIDIVPEGVLLLSEVGVVVRANAAGRRDLQALAAADVGTTVTALGGRPLREFLTSPPAQGLWHELKYDGRHYQLLARPFENGPELGGWVLVIRDVTQQYEMQHHLQQQERLAALGQMAAGIAHDFNNILATIVLYAQMAARSPGIGPRDRERMGVINQQAQNAAQLIQQILDFSRRAILERRPLDLLSLIKEQVKLLQRTFPENISVTLKVTVQREDDFIIHADPTRMQQMIMNLALNARDAMPNGGALHIGLERVQVEQPRPDLPAGDWVRITVADTGFGIPPEALPHIFEPFFTTKPPGQGSGLGLSQVHGIVGVHEGHLQVQTEVGKGTTFTIHLPALAASASQLLREEARGDLPLGRGETVLVVEDDPVVRAAIVAGLESLNYRVREAANGHEALRLLETAAHEVALILSDVVMPEMGGIALFHALRDRQVQIPLILLSGHPLEGEIEQLEGLAGRLTKPPGLEELAHALHRALGMKREDVKRET